MIASIKDNARLAAIGLFGRPYGIFELIADYNSRYADSTIVVDFNLAASPSQDMDVQSEKLAA